ncbi:hypothetical protein ACMVCI_004681 [Yersinia enterocolitica]|uniref:hypothetical protein n=1 Tax=Yersinia enterocolitica TaxID=630 RepID=UPI0021E76676|nr:hypothetical protein [Yersinia enterocolitica]EKN4075776.1 hypothetical protein [Yersinia enterocolitica]EKN4145892.1 hypothetical protein [Yersinia enterocolitica]ELI8121031.1 hypothetical protein [Yersinia enterocolitica]UYJ82687.1 hypothetical protein N4219_09500 [Yersinia enterocolitica]HDL7334632.1 hypothetical protein [Yersinia enterocolitica]
MSENTDYETLKAERDAGLTLISRLVFENAALTDKAASELSNAWLLHRAVMTIQAALHCIHGTNIYEAQCWLESIADDAELVIPPEMMLSDLQRWFDENMTGLITHAQAVEIIKAEMSATTQAINEIKAQGVDEQVSRLEGEYGELDDVCVMVFRDLREFAASLRGEHEIKS